MTYNGFSHWQSADFRMRAKRRIGHHDISCTRVNPDTGKNKTMGERADKGTIKLIIIINPRALKIYIWAAFNSNERVGADGVKQRLT